MLSLIITYRIILIIHVIIALNNLDYKQIINGFYNKKFQDEQYFKNCPRHTKSQDWSWQVLRFQPRGWKKKHDWWGCEPHYSLAKSMDISYQ